MGTGIASSDPVSATSLRAMVEALANDRRMPLYELSLKADLDPSTLPKAFNRGHKLRPQSLRDIARVLEVPFLQLLFEQEDISVQELQEFRAMVATVDRGRFADGTPSLPRTDVRKSLGGD